MAKVNLKTQGFSLIEVMIAMAIFAVFVVSFITGQSYNVLQSSNMRTDIEISELAKLKINEILINLPDLKETIGSTSSHTKEYKEYPGYQYSLVIKKMEIPNYQKLQSNKEEDASKKIQAVIFNQIKKNIEKLVWQLELTITRKETSEKYTLSTWVYNHKNDQVVFEGI